MKLPAELKAPSEKVQILVAERIKITGAVMTTQHSLGQAEADLDTARSEQARQQAAAALQDPGAPTKATAATKQAREKIEVLEDRLAGLAQNLQAHDAKLAEARAELRNSFNAWTFSELNKITEDYNTAVGQFRKAVQSVLDRSHGLGFRGNRIFVRIRQLQVPSLNEARRAIEGSLLEIGTDAELAAVVRDIEALLVEEIGQAEIAPSANGIAQEAMHA